MGTGKFNAGDDPVMDKHPIQGGVEMFLVGSCYINRDKLWQYGPLGSNTDFTFSFTFNIKRIIFELPLHPTCKVALRTK